MIFYNLSWYKGELLVFNETNLLINKSLCLICFFEYFFEII